MRVYDKQEKKWMPRDEFFMSCFDGDLYHVTKTMFGNYKMELVSSERYITHQCLGFSDMDGNLVYEGDICDAILPDKSASVNEIGFEYPSTNTVYQKTTKDNIDTKIDPQPPFDEREKQEYEALKLYPVLQGNPELKARFDYLNKKYGYVQHSPSIDANDIDPIERVEPKVNKVEVYLERLTKNFSSAQELLQDMITNGISVEEIKEFNKSNPKELAKHIG